MAKKKAAGRSSTKKTKRSPKKPAAKKSAQEKAEVPTKEMRHYAEILQLNQEVAAAFQNWDVAKHEAKSLKEIYEVKCGALHSLINEGPDPQMPLNFGEETTDGGTPTKPQAAWMARPLGVLGLPKGLIIKLEEAGMDTIGQLDQFWKDGRVLTDLKGIAAEKAAQIADAWANYGKEHPEVYGMDEQAEETENDEEPEGE